MASSLKNNNHHTKNKSEKNIQCKRIVQCNRHRPADSESRNSRANVHTWRSQIDDAFIRNAGTVSFRDGNGREIFPVSCHLCGNTLFTIHSNRLCHKVSCSSTDHYYVGSSIFLSLLRSICGERTGTALFAGLYSVPVYRQW